MKSSCRLIMLCLTGLLLSGCGHPTPQWRVEVTPLGPFPKQTPETPPQERVRVEYLANEKRRAIVDGKPGPEFDWIDGWFVVGEWNSPGSAFVAPGGRTVYTARNDGKWVVILDGKAGPISDQLPQPIVFSTYGEHCVYVVTQADKCRAVIDGNPGPVYDRIEPWGFTVDGRAFYIAAEKGEQLLVLDGQTERRFKEIYGWPAFSKDGKRVGYVVGETVGEQEFQRAVIDGKVEPLHRSIGEIVFSPDSKHVAHGVSDMDYTKSNDDDLASFVVFDGQQGPRFQSVSTIAYSPDSKRFVYIARTKQGDRVVLDGVAGPAWPHIGLIEYMPQLPSPFIFSPDSKRLAYLAASSLRERHGFLPEQELIVVVDGRPQDKWKVAPMLSNGPFGVFSPDGRHFAFVAKGEKQWSARVVIDGQEGPEFGWVSWPSEIRFLPDGSLEYQAGNDQNRYQVRHFMADGK